MPRPDTPGVRPRGLSRAAERGPARGKGGHYLGRDEDVAIGQAALLELAGDIWIKVFYLLELSAAMTAARAEVVALLADPAAAAYDDVADSPRRLALTTKKKPALGRPKT